MTRGRAATPEPFDLGAVAGTDELLEALSTRRLADLSTGRTDADDPAVGLLSALVADVDAGAPPLPVPARVSCGMPGRRRGVRVVVTFGVAALVLTSAGAAAAGGGHGVGAMRTTHGPVGSRGAERSNANTQRQGPASQTPLTDRDPAARHLVGAHRDAPVSPKDDSKHVPDDLLWDHHPHRQPRTASPSPTETGQPTPDPAPSWGPIQPAPTPTPDEPPPAP